MVGEVTVMKPEDYAQWLASGKTEGSLASQGEKLFQEFGCITCHRPDSGARGPNLQGLYGRPVRLSDNRVVIADDNYIRESILQPNAKIVSGFQPIMPTFQGVVSEEGLIQITEYLKSLSEQESQPLNNRSVPTELRDNEVPAIQQELQEKKPAKQPESPGKKP
jgi:cytochrome c oxidase subunit 2